MSLAKVVNRKQSKALSVSQIKTKRLEVIESFRQYVLSQVDELNKIFPSVVIGEGEFDNNVVGVTYSPSIWTGSKRHTISSTTCNICLDSVYPEFHIGYGANTASGRPFKFDWNMTKPQLKRFYKQMLEYLVSESYRVGYENNRAHQVWKGNERLI
ncbi:hypothetical protein COE51_01155 [Bacillus pseudomycoides]|nr:hypothetical protein COE51_01155 [Bacillus pseudomycoides]